MPSTAYGLKKLQSVQMGLESAKGTLVAATQIWHGPAHLELGKGDGDSVEIPEYPQGIPGDVIVEDGFISDTGTKLVLEDTELSVEQLAYLFNMGIKAAVSSAGTTPFLLDNFAMPTSPTINDISTFTFEVDDGLQEYEFGYGFVEEINLHGDVDSNNGRCLMNAVVRGRKRVASTKTASLSIIPNIEPLNLNAGSLKIDALGTAAGTASAIADLLVAFNLKIVTGFTPDRSASGRADKDFSQALYNGEHKVSGSLIFKMKSNAVTHIANARSATGIVAQIAIPGTGTRAVKANLPLIFDSEPNWGNSDRQGVHTVEMSFRAGYSRTSTAQGVSFPVNMSASTTII